MEKEKNTFKQGTRKTQIGSSGGGNIGGLLLFGGALAVGSLVATLAARKGNRRRDNDDKTRRSKLKEEKASQGLHFILETSSPTFHGDQCCSSNGSTEMVEAQIDPSELISTPRLILEVNLSSATNSSLENSDNEDREILLTYGSKQESVEMCSKHCRVEQFSLPELENDTIQETNLMATSAIVEKHGIEAVRTSTEEISSVQSTEEDGEDNEEEKRKQTKEKLLSEEITEVSEKEESTGLETCAVNFSLNSVEEEDGDNLETGPPLMEIIEVNQEEEATDGVREEDAIDAVKISIEEILSIKSSDTEDDDEENKQANEKLLLEGKIEVEQEEEQIAKKTRAEKTSLNSVEEDDDKILGKGSVLMDVSEVKQREEDAIGVVKMSIEEISSVQVQVQSTDKEEDDEENRQAKEKFLQDEKIEVEEEEEEEERIVEKTSSNSIEEEDSDDNLGKGSALMNIPEVKQDEDPTDEVAEEDAIDIVKMSIQEISSVQSMEEDSDNEEERKHSIDEKANGDIERNDDELILKKSEENSARTGTSSAGSDAEEISPAESIEALTQELMNIMKTSRLTAAKTGVYSLEQAHNYILEEMENRQHEYANHGINAAPIFTYCDALFYLSSSQQCIAKLATAGQTTLSSLAITENVLTFENSRTFHRVWPAAAHRPS